MSYDKIVGFDVGTGNLVSAVHAGSTRADVVSMRNTYLPISPSDLSQSEISNTALDYVEVYDGDDLETIAIIGEDAFKFANIFGQVVRRPMAAGVISTSEIDAMDIVTLMIEKLIGRTENGYCIYSVPAQAVDVKIPPVSYHESVFGKIFASLGYKSKSLNEGAAVVYSECEKENFTGIGISFGAGLTNVACLYRGVPAVSFSVSRGGDWIDNTVAESLGLTSTRITSIKERDDFNLVGLPEGKKDIRRIKSSLQLFYENLIKYTLQHFISEFTKAAQGISIDEPIPIVLSGGTSKANGFLDCFKKVFAEMEDKFPYEISEIRVAKDQLNAVALGNLVYGMWDVLRLPSSRVEN